MQKDIPKGWRFTIDERVEIGANAPRVWRILDDHEAMPAWVRLGLRRVELLADGAHSAGTVGSLRRIHFVGWPAVTERFVAIDAPRGYSYAVIAGMPHLRYHLGEVSLEPAPDAVVVRWSITFVFNPLHPLSWFAPLFVAGFRWVVRSGLSTLVSQVATA